MSFQQGLSGLNATSKSLDVMGNNIANSNTYGAKSARAEFADVYAGAIIGTGVSLVNVSQQFTQGNLTATANPLDLAIDGSGFFQVADGSGTVYSRNGQFKVDRDGYIVNNQKQQLMGYPADANGLIVPGKSTPLITPTGAGVAPKITDSIKMELNLPAGAADTEPLAVLNAATLALAAATAAQTANPSTANAAVVNAAQIKFDAATASNTAAVAKIAAGQSPVDFKNPKTYNNATSITAYDNLGREVAVTFYFQKATDYANPALPVDKWNVYVTADGVEIPANSLGPRQVIFSGGIAQPMLPAGVETLDILASVPPASTRSAITGVTLDISRATQFGSPFAVTDLSQNGYAPGQMVGIEVGDNGIVSARYSNGKTQAVGQVVIANFRNPQGLQPLGGNAWAGTFASGEPIPGAPGDGNLGRLQSGKLEESNVDLTGELVAMMMAQRTYQANAQTIKTQDQVLQTLVNLR